MRSENRLSDSPTDSPCSNNKNPLIPHFYCLGPHFPSGWIFLQHSAASFGRRQGPVALHPSSAPGGHRLRRGTDLVPCQMGWKWMTCRIHRKKMQKKRCQWTTLRLVLRIQPADLDIQSHTWDVVWEVGSDAWWFKQPSATEAEKMLEVDCHV